MQRQEEGPFRLKGLGVGNLLFCVQTGGLLCCLYWVFLADAVVCISPPPCLMFDVLDAHVLPG